jgi:hypothetical protein
MKEIELNQWIMADVHQVCGSLYRMNAPYTMGYLFNVIRNGRKIFDGMFCNRESEISSDRWTYFFNFKTKRVYKI